MLLMSAVLAVIGLQRTDWLNRVVQYQKEKLFSEIRKLAPININAEIRPKPEGYKDSNHWDYDSVLRLLTLIRGSETAKPVHKALRRMLQPTRRLMMSMKESMHRFPSIKKDDNTFYYDVEYSEEGKLPAPPPVPEDQVVLVVSNPVEARLPSARISVKLLREILEARSRAARQMPSTTHIIPWVEYIKTRKSSTEASTRDSNADRMTVTDGAADRTTAADGADDGTTFADSADDGTTEADSADDGMTEADGADYKTTEVDGADDKPTEADDVNDQTTEADGADDEMTVAGGVADGTTVADGVDEGMTIADDTDDGTTVVGGADNETTVADDLDDGATVADGVGDETTVADGVGEETTVENEPVDTVH